MEEEYELDYKKIIITALIAFVIIGGVAFLLIHNKKNAEPLRKLDDIKGVSNVSMEVNQDTLNNTNAAIVITDTSDNDNVYGEWFRIDKLEDKKWQEVKTLDYEFSFNDIEYRVEDDNKLEMSHNWEFIYGGLDSGEYRIVKKVNNKDYISAEFKID